MTEKPSNMHLYDEQTEEDNSHTMHTPLEPKDVTIRTFTQVYLCFIYFSSLIKILLQAQYNIEVHILNIIFPSKSPFPGNEILVSPFLYKKDDLLTVAIMC